MNFGQLEAALSAMHDIAPTKRTAFQARLKNLHRLRFPVGFRQVKGKAAVYSPADSAHMALAVEFIQMGWTPDAVVRTLALNWTVITGALEQAAASILSSFEYYKLNSLSSLATHVPLTYIAFSPNSLASLRSEFESEEFSWQSSAADFFCLELSQLEKWLERNDKPRISVLNLTTVLLGLVGGPPLPEEGEIYVKAKFRFFNDILRWVDDQRNHLAGGHTKFLLKWISVILPLKGDTSMFDEEVKFIVGKLGATERAAVSALKSYRREGLGDVDPEA